MIRLVTFDALFTLIRPRKPIYVQYAEVFEPYLGKLNPDSLKQSFKLALKQLQKERPVYAAGVTEWWGEVIRRTASGAGADTEVLNRSLLDIVPDLMHRFSSRNGYVFFPDAVPAIRALQLAGVRTGVVTNADARMRGVFNSLGGSSIDGDGAPLALDPLIISEEIGSEKPAANIFASVCNTTGLQASEVLHVGDELEADYRGATSFGMHALLLRRPSPDGDDAPKEPGEDLAGVDIVNSLGAVVSRVAAL